MKTAVSASEAQRLILDNVDWPSYRALLRLLEGRRGIRLTYDRGTIEIMTLTFEHESWGHFFDRIVIVLTEELGLPLAAGGSTTFRRRRRRRGLEADECYWILNEAAVRGKSRIDLRTDPPPDLALEVDITHSSLDRLAIYAALRVPEVWRFDGRLLEFLILKSSGGYAAESHSRAFPRLAAADLAPFLALRNQTDENSAIRQFRDWVRQQLVPSSKNP